MVKFILNNETIETDLPPGITVLDFVRYRKNLKGTKIGCREGDCGACTVLVGGIMEGDVQYRSMTSCLMPIANAHGKHVVTVEGINPPEGDLTPVQRALVDESGTQCGFCTVGFVMSMTGFCVNEFEKTEESAVSAIDGNICRCTGYKPIERASKQICEQLAEERGHNSKNVGDSGRLDSAIDKAIVPEYFSGIQQRLGKIKSTDIGSGKTGSKMFVGGGTDLYVQRHDEMVYSDAEPLYDVAGFNGIREIEGMIEIGGSATVTDMLESQIMHAIFPGLYNHLKLVSSTPIRNMATLAGNFVNASPIGDMTVWFLALNAGIVLQDSATLAERSILLRDLYLGYKELAKAENEIVKTIRFKRPYEEFRFNFEKVSKRTFLDIASVNTGISMRVDSGTILEAHVAAGGVAPIPLYLAETSSALAGKKVCSETVLDASQVLLEEISPISDVRGSAAYKRLLLKQLFAAHFFEIFAV